MKLIFSETMTGIHEFCDDSIMFEGIKLPMEFNIDCCVHDLKQFLNPHSGNFMVANIDGTISIKDVCENVPCEGRMYLRYLSDQTIKYVIEFEADGVDYEYVGKKVNIKPWNLLTSHTTCFGTLTNAKTGELVSTSVTYFRLRTSYKFLSSFGLRF